MSAPKPPPKRTPPKHARAPRQPKGDHVVLGGGGVRCLHCGNEQAIVPCSITVMAAICRAYAADHTGCAQSEAGLARFRYTTPDEWLRSWDTGLSSKTIFSVFAPGHGAGGAGDLPHDSDDFGRCYRLLRAFPDWRQDLHRVSERFPAWVQLVMRWAEIEAAYEAELAAGRPGKVYALLKEVR